MPPLVELFHCFQSPFVRLLVIFFDPVKMGTKKLNIFQMTLTLRTDFLEKNLLSVPLVSSSSIAMIRGLFLCLGGQC